MNDGASIIKKIYLQKFDLIYNVHQNCELSLSKLLFAKIFFGGDNRSQCLIIESNLKNCFEKLLEEKNN
jgi:hypothetical protein